MVFILLWNDCPKIIVSHLTSLIHLFKWLPLKETLFKWLSIKQTLFKQLPVRWTLFKQLAFNPFNTLRSCKIRLFKRQNRGMVIRDTRHHEITIMRTVSEMLISRCHIRLPLAPGMVCQPATRWPLHLVKGPFCPWNFQKLPQKCNFNCYLCQSFHWLGPDLVPCGEQMWSSIVLTMRWF